MNTIRNNKEPSCAKQDNTYFVFGFALAGSLCCIRTLQYYRTEVKKFFETHDTLMTNMQLTQEEVRQQKRIHLLTETWFFPMSCCTLLLLLLAINEYHIMHQKKQ